MWFLSILVPLLFADAEIAQHPGHQAEQIEAASGTLPPSLEDMSFSERLSARWRGRDHLGSAVCEGLEKDFQESEMTGYSYQNTGARRLMLRCGHDLSELVKADISSGVLRRGQIGILTWSLQYDNKYFVTSDIGQFVIEALVSSEPISNWNSPEAKFPYYMAVTALIEAGELDELRRHLATRNDATDFDEYLEWRDRNEKLRRPLR